MKLYKFLVLQSCCLLATTLVGKSFEPYQWEKERPRYKLSEKDGSYRN